MGVPTDVVAKEGAFLLENLPYAYDALSPTISAMTLENHYSKHYLAYTNNFNKAVVGTGLENLSIEEVLKQMDLTNTELRINAGGYYNHSLYWKSMAPKGVRKPTDSIASTINRDFGSFENFKSVFIAEAVKQSGSAWTWLVVDGYGKLQVTSTQNNDNPLMRNSLIRGTPIIALDLWEHSFYLDYQYKRRTYIDAFFRILDWKNINLAYLEAIKGKKK